MNRESTEKTADLFFVLGIDPIPDWFMDLVSTNQITLHGSWNHLDSATIVIDGSMHEVDHGKMIFRDSMPKKEVAG